MNIQVRLNGHLSVLAGRSRAQITVDETERDGRVTVADVLAELSTQYPQTAASIKSAVSVIGGRHVPHDTIVSAGQEVAVLVPIAGGG